MHTLVSQLMYLQIISTCDIPKCEVSNSYEIALIRDKPCVPAPLTTGFTACPRHSANHASYPSTNITNFNFMRVSLIHNIQLFEFEFANEPIGNHYPIIISPLQSTAGLMLLHSHAIRFFSLLQPHPFRSLNYVISPL